MAKWEQPTFKYQGKCLGRLRDEYARISDNGRMYVNTALEGTGSLLSSPKAASSKTAHLAVTLLQ